MNDPSPFYENVLSLSLDPELISPISYCVAYDLIKRFEKFEFSRKQEIQESIKSKEEQKEKKVRDLRERQKDSTLNWIERRITSTFININKPNFNPTDLYWQDKDLKSATDSIKLHSELEGNIVERFNEFFQFTVEKIKSFTPEMPFPDERTMKDIINTFINKLLRSRLKRNPNSEEIKNMFEGERYKISEEISKEIGKIFDKILYMKFKSSRKK